MVYFSFNLAKNSPIYEKTYSQKLVTKNCQGVPLVTLSLLLRFFLYCGFLNAKLSIFQICVDTDVIPKRQNRTQVINEVFQVRTLDRWRAQQGQVRS